jgi:hypothetical protein
MGKFNSDKAEMTWNPEKSGLPKPTDYKNKKINTVRERERYIIYIYTIYIEAYDKLNHNCIVHQKEYTPVGLCWILVFRWSEDVYILHHFTSSFWMCPVTPRSCQWCQRPCKASRQMGTQGDRERHLRYPSMHREKCVKKGT